MTQALNYTKPKSLAVRFKENQLLDLNLKL